MKTQIPVWQSPDTAPTLNSAIAHQSMDVKLIETAAAFLLKVSRAAETIVDGEAQH